MSAPMRVRVSHDDPWWSTVQERWIGRDEIERADLLGLFLAWLRAHPDFLLLWAPGERGGLREMSADADIHAIMARFEDALAQALGWEDNDREASTGP